MLTNKMLEPQSYYFLNNPCTPVATAMELHIATFCLNTEVKVHTSRYSNAAQYRCDLCKHRDKRLMYKQAIELRIASFCFYTEAKGTPKPLPQWNSISLRYF